MYSIYYYAVLFKKFFLGWTMFNWHDLNNGIIYINEAWYFGCMIKMHIADKVPL